MEILWRKREEDTRFSRVAMPPKDHRFFPSSPSDFHAAAA
jgi:hypothetical protein